MSVSLSVRLSIYSSVCLSVDPSLYLSVCLNVKISSILRARDFKFGMKVLQTVRRLGVRSIVAFILIIVHTYIIFFISFHSSVYLLYV